MTDKPIAAKIILTLTDKKETGESFLSLFTTLYLQNLIFEEPRELRKIKNVLELSVIFYDIDSYKNWMKNSDVINYYSDKFKTKLARKPKTIKEQDVIIEVDKVENCTCNKSKFYILYGRSWQFCDELICGDCLKLIPYSKIPLDIEIEDWQRHHQRIYMNWLDSGLFEKEAYKELTNYKKGKLNIEGERIRKQLSEYFKIPVYIYYFVEEATFDTVCGLCGDKGIKSGLKSPHRICKKCNTAFGYDDKKNWR